MHLHTRLLPLLFVVALPASAQVVPGRSGTTAEFRAIHAPSDSVVWAAGRAGHYTVTTDAGTTWRSDSVPGAADLFITGIWARDARTAVVIGTAFEGAAARIYRTDDGGSNWQQQFERSGTGVFFDALRCLDDDGRQCIAFSDPVDGAFLIVRTTDGRTWSQVPVASVPAPLTGEAGFAASGQAMTVSGSRHAWIGTGGGEHARVYRTRDAGASWDVATTPMPGNATSGIFGIAFTDTLNGVAVGGDYARPRDVQQNVMRTTDGGRTWTVVGASVPAGVRYGAAVRAAGGTTIVVAPGPSGVGVSGDGGVSWRQLDTTHYNTATFSPAGDLYLAGPLGRIAKVTAASLTSAAGGR